MNITESYLLSLLTDEHDFTSIISELEGLGRPKADDLEGHHVEPERERVVYLTPLEHLAIHIAHARLEPTGSNNAKVAAFVRWWPGSYRRQLELNPELTDALISFGQSRPGAGVRLAAHPNTIAIRHRPQPHAAENGRRGAVKTRGKPRKTPITWGDKIGAAARAEPVFTCEHCGKKVKRKANLVQHQRSTKCPRNQATSLETPQTSLNPPTK